MPGRTMDAMEKRDELRALVDSRRPGPMLEAVRRAQVALDFRGTDAMIGLDTVDEALLDELRAAIQEVLTAAAALGHAPAAVELGKLHLQRRDPDAALAALEPAARAGDAHAAALAAQTVWRSGKLERHAEALAWLNAARERDPDGRAHYMLGLLAFNGIGGPVDRVEAGRLHEVAAARGSADAMFELYVLTDQGVGRPADGAAALDWCRRSAEAGNVRAMGNLGGFYATGNNLPQDPALALQWYERAAHAGHGRSAATLGVMYATGDCVEQDPAQARAWLAAADALGFDWRDMADAVGLDPDEWE